jgi:hypothetical protein
VREDRAGSGNRRIQVCVEGGGVEALRALLEKRKEAVSHEKIESLEIVISYQLSVISSKQTPSDLELETDHEN